MLRFHCLAYAALAAIHAGSSALLLLNGWIAEGALAGAAAAIYGILCLASRVSLLKEGSDA